MYTVKKKKIRTMRKGEAQGFRTVVEGGKETIEPIYGDAELTLISGGAWQLEVKDKEGVRLFFDCGRHSDNKDNTARPTGMILYKNRNTFPIIGCDAVYVTLDWLQQPTSAEAKRMYTGFPACKKFPQLSANIFPGVGWCKHRRTVQFLTVWWRFNKNHKRLWDNGKGTLDQFKGVAREPQGYHLDNFNQDTLTFEEVPESDGLQFDMDLEDLFN